ESLASLGRGPRERPKKRKVPTQAKTRPAPPATGNHHQDFLIGATDAAAVAASVTTVGRSEPEPDERPGALLEKAARRDSSVPEAVTNSGSRTAAASGAGIAGTGGAAGAGVAGRGATGLGVGIERESF